MKCEKAINSDDGMDIQKTIKQGLTTLSFAIIFLSGVALWTVLQLTGFYNNNVNTLSEQIHEIHLMRIAARERALLSYQMINEKDTFKKITYSDTLYGQGEKYLTARQNLVKYPLKENELRLLEKHNQLVGTISPIQEKILEQVIEDKNEPALELLREKLLPAQVKGIKLLDELSQSIEKRYQVVVKKADSLSHVNIIVLVSIVVVIILGALYILRKTTFRSSLLLSHLSETRKMLQDTLYELIQQKDTLDHHAIVSIADRKGNITYINEKFCEISGYRHGELIGQNHRILKSDIHPNEFYQDLWNTISHGKVWSGKICNRAKDGSHYWVESTISPFLDEKGIPDQYVSIRTDITDLFESKMKAEEASNAKSIFLSSMSHEIRTPMNAIIGFTQLLGMDTKNERQQSYVEEISNAGEHLLGLINEILDLAQIESGKLVLVISNYNLKDIIESCLNIIKPAADNRSIQIEDRISVLPGIDIKVDEVRFKQVVLNLLSNAVKYNKEKGKLIVECAQGNDHMLTLTIADTGIGISPEQQSHLFNPFDRAGQENYNIPGSGLGLVIAKNIIESMNGSIGFKSTINEGSRFWIKIPLA